MFDIDDANYWRECARDLWSVAKGITDPELRQTLCEIAVECEALAEEAARS